MKVKRFDEAEQELQAAVAAAEQLAEQAATSVRVQILLISVLEARGDLEVARERNSDARNHYTRALRIAQELHDQGKLTGTDAQWLDRLQSKLQP